MYLRPPIACCNLSCYHVDVTKVRKCVVAHLCVVEFPAASCIVRARVIVIACLNPIAAVLIQLRTALANQQALYTGVMADKKRGKSERDHAEEATEASTTTVEPNTTRTGTGVPTIRIFEPPDSSSSPDTGTPLPDDPSALKESVKGLKSQLRRRKRQVLLHRSSTAHETYPAIARR